ncbi:alanine racemase [Bacillus alkalicellulosilyticus]|uniref:alanine racemase n=1 Tax=Alkalihalobacterium alkalicellulosilyticum TaxID=1912214 RepID=UPI0009987FC5|nr:alanine racemase [Bacillus alkalicellulosilyticus]
MDFSQLDTPSLLLDLEKLETNIEKIALFAQSQGIGLRPHIKTHKSVRIAKMQLSKGAVGITVAKLSEAEEMVKGGITNILIAYPIASKQKLERLSHLLRRASIIITADSVEQVECLEQFFSSKSLNVTLWIKVNSGLNRCGVEPGEEVIELARRINSSQHLTLTGIFTHAGHAYGAKSIEEIKQIARQEAKSVVQSADACEKIGIPIIHRSVGSTPTFTYAGMYKGITEIRPGNAAFFDMVQVSLGVANVEQCAVSILATVVSKKKNHLVLDAGSKALTLEKGAHGNESVNGYGTIVGHPELTLSRLSEEHGVATFIDSTPLELNDVVTIIPNHACPVVNLYEVYHVIKDNTVIETWSIDARGKVY